MFDDLLRCADGASVNLDRCEDYSACNFFTQGNTEFDSPSMLAFHIPMDVVGAATLPFGTILENRIGAVSVLRFDAIS